MAKRRNAAALFEVIHTDARFPKRHDTGDTWSFSPMRWFRQRRGAASDAAPVEAVAAPSRAAAEPSGPSLFERLGGVIGALVPPMPRFGMTLDADRQTVRFQLSYTAAMIGAFAIVAGVALAYVVGRQTAARPRPALAEVSTDELKNGPANPDVLDIGNDDDGPPMAMATNSVRTGAAAPPAKTAGAAKPDSATARTPSWNEPKGPTTFVVDDPKRTVGLTYVVIQSYPPEERAMAEEAVKLLNGKQVLCTTETGLPWAPRWVSVVGIKGFDRIRDSREYDQYLGRINQINDEMGGTVRFKRFDPKPFKWKEARP